MRVAYADPPYPGCGGYYPERQEVHVGELVRRLHAEFPDGWALSTHTNALRDVLPLCPPDVRVCAWVKGWASWKPGVHPKYAWEPVLVRGGRRPPPWTVRDWHRENVVTMHPEGFIGSKPPGFCRWVFHLLGLEAGDELVDLYPGSGAVTVAWQDFCAQRPLLLENAP